MAGTARIGGRVSGTYRVAFNVQLRLLAFLTVGILFTQHTAVRKPQKRRQKRRRSVWNRTHKTSVSRAV